MSSHYQDDMKNNAANEEYWRAVEMRTPFMKLRPALYPDGNMWCALYGKNLQEGVAGFGATPQKAAEDFDRNWLTGKAGPPSGHVCARCGQPNPNREPLNEGCRDPDCPES